MAQNTTAQTPSVQSSAPVPVIIGQDNPIISSIEQGLITAGVSVAEVSLAAAAPWTQLPIIGWLVDEGIKFGITEVVNEVDLIAYTIYVSIEDSIRVSNYVQAQNSGNEAAIDAAADALINLQGE